jgi:hypothetical protein
VMGSRKDATTGEARMQDPLGADVGSGGRRLCETADPLGAVCWGSVWRHKEDGGRQTSKCPGSGCGGGRVVAREADTRLGFGWRVGEAEAGRWWQMRREARDVATREVSGWRACGRKGGRTGEEKSTNEFFLHFVLFRSKE